MSPIRSHARFFALVAVLLLAVWLRLPRIGEAMPFFYDEDEAHHFNRVVNMVKTGDLNPRYFHKPSLHFYLRIPAVAVSFLWNVRRGNIRSVQEIVTSNPHGVGDYAFTLSHPSVAKWNRAFSVLLSVGMVLLTYLLARSLAAPPLLALLATTASAVSPELVSNSATIGVDVVVGFFALATTYFALRSLKEDSLGLLAGCAVLSGLTMSAKYNALPIALVPIVACAFAHPKNLQAWIVALVGPLCGFLIGTPYAITQLPLFLDQMGYEVWHYGVASHEGHFTEPGWRQALFYLQWLTTSGLGPILTAFGTVGALLLVSGNRARNSVFLTFPVLYAALMISQRANFTRNMLVEIPFFSVIAVVALDTILTWVRSSARARAVVGGAFALAALGYPTALSLSQRAEALQVRDSRSEAREFLLQSNDLAEVGISAELQFPPDVYRIPHISEFEQGKNSALDLLLDGYDTAVLARAYEPNNAPKLPIVRSFEGDATRQRIVKSPAIDIVKIQTPDNLSQILTSVGVEGLVPTLPFDVAQAGDTNCTARSAHLPEDYCWITKRVEFLQLDGVQTSAAIQSGAERITLNLELMTPWPNQRFTIAAGDWSQEVSLGNPGAWSSVTIQVPRRPLLDDGKIVAFTDKITSPRVAKTGEDARRLGVAVRRISLP